MDMSTDDDTKGAEAPKTEAGVKLTNEPRVRKDLAERLKDVDDQLLEAAEYWAGVVIMANCIAIEMTKAPCGTKSHSSLLVMTRDGVQRRDEIRKCWRDAERAQAHALEIRSEILGEKRRGPVPRMSDAERSQPDVEDPSTKALREAAEAKKRRKEERRAMRHAPEPGSELYEKLMAEQKAAAEAAAATPAPETPAPPAEDPK